MADTDCLANQQPAPAANRLTPGEQAEAERVERHLAQWGPDRAARLCAEQAARLSNNGT